MIYLSKNTDAQRVKIPRVLFGEPKTLKLSSTFMGGEVSLPVEVVTTKNLYIEVEVTMTSKRLPEGEYVYEMTSEGGRAISKGVAIVGDYAPDVVDNEDNEIIYKQYGE